MTFYNAAAETTILVIIGAFAAQIILWLLVLAMASESKLGGGAKFRMCMLSKEPRAE
ncbi:hypothetical protein BCR37DRAFT_377940 [Protomyces lactucae-debilis]|uniref:Uncharacterized protein n=1 Tax=Protomyces lactucae-debilis TaxID=2754530 RepID=A0A1Y2FP46_PROLT|nr:uncharacterized protein BCR37DRAFT_377940 [Protomyces lactucae-debilis]ORY84976.1 hypothetical protein BCR37DRAFT_377940 [Protomyces lactucae-debilis]